MIKFGEKSGIHRIQKSTKNMNDSIKGKEGDKINKRRLSKICINRYTIGALYTIVREQYLLICNNIFKS